MWHSIKISVQVCGLRLLPACELEHLLPGAGPGGSQGHDTGVDS